MGSKAGVDFSHRDTRHLIDWKALSHRFPITISLSELSATNFDRHSPFREHLADLSVLGESRGLRAAQERYLGPWLAPPSPLARNHRNKTHRTRIVVRAPFSDSGCLCIMPATSARIIIHLTSPRPRALPCHPSGFVRCVMMRRETLYLLWRAGRHRRV